MKFVTLTYKNGDTVLLNLDLVTQIARDDSKEETNLYGFGEDKWAVTETPMEILDMIGDDSAKLETIIEQLSRIETNTENTYYAVK